MLPAPSFLHPEILTRRSALKSPIKILKAIPVSVSILPPVTRGVANAQKDRFVLAFGFLKRLLLFPIGINRRDY